MTTNDAMLALIQAQNNRLARVSADYLHETVGWHTSTSDTTKMIPYASSWEALRSLQRVGDGMYQKCPVVRAAIEKFISYVVGPGHGYDVIKRDVSRSKTGVRVGQRLINEIEYLIEEIQSTCFPGGWAAMQSETISRWLRHGEYFRRKFATENGLQVRFVEPFQVRTPPATDLDSKDLGLIFGPFDRTVPLGYWVLRDLENPGDPRNYDPIDAVNIQHAKQGVDANDYRGVTPFFMVLCHSDRIRLTDMAMVELALTQSAYAVVRQYEETITINDIRRIAKNFKEGSQDQNGERTFGKEVEARGYKLEFPSMGTDPNSFVAIINEEKRSIAGVLDMPDFILLAGGADSSRAGNVSKEGPFARRILREQTAIGHHDVDLLWDGIAIAKGWSLDQKKAYQRAISIIPDFPVPYTRDILKDTQALKLQVESKLQSREGASQKLGNDWRNVRREIERESSLEPDGSAAPVVDAGDREPSGNDPQPSRP